MCESTSPIGLVDLSHEEIDLGVRFGKGDYPGLRVDRLFDETVFPVLQSQAARRSAPLEAAARPAPSHLDPRRLAGAVGNMARLAHVVSGRGIARSGPATRPAFHPDGRLPCRQRSTVRAWRCANRPSSPTIWHPGAWPGPSKCPSRALPNSPITPLPRLAKPAAGESLPRMDRRRGRADEGGAGRRERPIGNGSKTGGGVLLVRSPAG